MTYSQIQHPYVTPPVVCCSPFRARPPAHPLSSPRCPVPLVERPYFFVPRNYSSQITGLYRGKLIMLQRLYEMEYRVARRRNKKVASNTTVECSVIIPNAGARRTSAGGKKMQRILRCFNIRPRACLHRFTSSRAKFLRQLTARARYQSR